MDLLLVGALFFIILLLFVAGYFLAMPTAPKRSIDQAMQRYTPDVERPEDINILFYRKFSDVKPLNRLLAAIPLMRHLDELMQQGRVRMLVGVFILLSLVIGGVCMLIGLQMSGRFDVALVCMAFGLYLPFLNLQMRRNQQRNRFEALFPDALDLMAYSLKAGHSIMSSFKMVAEEMSAPVSEEFGRVVDEVNFGNDLETTLHNFARRVDSTELRFFVTSVIIQRETGGNLVEILDKISETIRKKFRFRERVKALTAEGKVSAYILVALPFLIALAVTVLNPGYISVLVTDPVGPYLIVGACVSMSIGSFIMYRLVQLDM